MYSILVEVQALASHVKQCLYAPTRLLPMYDLRPCLSIVGETIGATCLIIFGGWGQRRTWILGTLRSNQVRKRWKIGFNQSLIDVHPIPLSQPFFYLPFFNSVVKKTILRQRKVLGH